jgi:hypothetical protein
MVGTTVLRVAHPNEKVVQGDKWVTKDVKWEIKSLAVWKRQTLLFEINLNNINYDQGSIAHRFFSHR